ncbi:MAG: FAD-binding oxidoreductase [Acidobacteriota bacterium]|nr:FAD-binding oxidoreductase [Acidobacteriota bacterium]
MLGIRPKVVFTPESPEEAAALLAATSRAAMRLAFVGGGTEIDLGSKPAGIEAVIRTERLVRIVEHAPSDQIAVVEAGVTLAALQRTAGAHGQRLALDAPWPERATLGGLIASNGFGPLRARYGSIRDLIIGISIVRADGTPSRGGGKVVKNVAGFDLPKLMVGSLGTLGLITTATFRLHPLPESSATVLLPRRAPGEVRALRGQIQKAQLEPASVVAVSPEGGASNGGRLLLDAAVTFEGFEAGVHQQRDRFTALVLQSGAARCEVLDVAAAQAFSARHDRARAEGAFRARFAAPVSAFETVAADVLVPLSELLASPAFVSYPTLGLGFLAGDPGPAETVGRAIAAARRSLAGVGGSLVLQTAPAAVRALADVWGATPPSWPLLQAMKARLDPERRLVPGRFVGGL